MTTTDNVLPEEVPQQVVYVLEAGEYDDRGIHSVWSDKQQLTAFLMVQGFKRHMTYDTSEGQHEVWTKPDGVYGSIEMFDRFTIHTHQVI